MRVNNESADEVVKYLHGHTVAARDACIDVLRARNCCPHFFPYIMAVITGTALKGVATVLEQKPEEKKLVLNMTEDALLVALKIVRELK